MRLESRTPAPVFGRRLFLGAAAAFAALPMAAAGQAQRYRVGFANLTEDPGARLEGFGFTGADVRASFISAARGQPIDLVFYDNDRNRAKALANADDAIGRKLDLYVQYCDDGAANADIAKRMKAAGIPVLALIHSVPGAPLYGPDDAVAGRIAADALVSFAAANWPDQKVAAVLVGDLGNAGDHVPVRAEAIAAALKERLPTAAQTPLDSNGNPAQATAQLRRYLAGQSGGKLLIAALDDTTALMAKSALEAAGRLSDAAIVSLGCDRSVHGGQAEKKEIDPNNRGSILLGSVAYLLDRYGYDVLPLALKQLKGEAVPPQTKTRHVLVTAANVFAIYPPIDMN
jgi:ABC-type sugar transport system substrate-binding protein